MSKEEFVEKVENIQDINEMINVLQAEVTSIKDEIKAEMNLQGREEMAVGIYEVNYIKTTNSRFDIKAFAEQHQDLYDQFTKVSEIKQLSII